MKREKNAKKELRGKRERLNRAKVFNKFEECSWKMEEAGVFEK